MTEKEKQDWDELYRAMRSMCVALEKVLKKTA
jgi:hypothetical protein